MHEKQFIKAYLRRLPLGWITLLMLFAGCLFLFGLVVHEVLLEQEEEIDQLIFNFLAKHVINDDLTGVMKRVTFFASSTFLPIAYAILFLLQLLLKNFMRALEIIGIGIGGFLLNYLMKWVFHRDRPANPLLDPLPDFSFPSGHAMFGFIFYGTLVYLIGKTGLPQPFKYVFSGILILFSLLIGFSRVYLRVHFPSDVMAGFCVGAAWLILSIAMMERVKQKAGQSAIHK